eukprot:s2533_g10.t1
MNCQIEAFETRVSNFARELDLLQLQLQRQQTFPLLVQLALQVLEGNVVDPLDAIADYGTDALRYALLTSSVPGMDVPVSKGGLENAKAFANKIWNVGRFIITEHEKNSETIATNFESGMQFSAEEIASMPWLERALLSKCHGLCESVTAALTANRFAPPTKEIKEFLQEDVASWYVPTTCFFRVLELEALVRRATRLLGCVDAAFCFLLPWS